MLRRYYAKVDLCPAYVIAVALHPNMKHAYFREQWKEKPDWIACAESTVKKVWKESYRGYRAAHRSPTPLLAHEDPTHLSQWDRKRQALSRTDVNVDMM